MSQTIEEEKNANDLATEITELKKRMKILEETVASMKLKLAKKWI